MNNHRFPRLCAVAIWIMVITAPLVGANVTGYQWRTEVVDPLVIEIVEGEDVLTWRLNCRHCAYQWEVAFYYPATCNEEILTGTPVFLTRRFGLAEYQHMRPQPTQSADVEIEALQVTEPRR